MIIALHDHHALCFGCCCWLLKGNLVHPFSWLGSLQKHMQSQQSSFLLLPFVIIGRASNHRESSGRTPNPILCFFSVTAINHTEVKVHGFSFYINDVWSLLCIHATICLVFPAKQQVPSPNQQLLSLCSAAISSLISDVGAKLQCPGFCFWRLSHPPCQGL